MTTETTPALEPEPPAYAWSASEPETVQPRGTAVITAALAGVAFCVAIAAAALVTMRPTPQHHYTSVSAAPIEQAPPKALPPPVVVPPPVAAPPPVVAPKAAPPPVAPPAADANQQFSKQPCERTQHRRVRQRHAKEKPAIDSGRSPTGH